MQMINYGNVYVAQIAMGADYNQTLKAFRFFLKTNKLALPPCSLDPTTQPPNTQPNTPNNPTITSNQPHHPIQKNQTTLVCFGKL